MNAIKTDQLFVQACGHAYFGVNDLIRDMKKVQQKADNLISQLETIVENPSCPNHVSFGISQVIETIRGLDFVDPSTASKLNAVAAKLQVMGRSA